MTTLSRTLRSADADTKIYLPCKIVCIRMFYTRRPILLSVVLIDKDGKIFEAKSWNPRKAYYIYFNFEEDQHVLLHCSPGFFTNADPRFSQAEYETSQKDWTLHPGKRGSQKRGHLNAFCDIAAFHTSSRPAKSVVGVFVEMGGGPVKFGMRGKVISEGHFVKMRDAKNRLFQVLVWENTNKKFTFSLNNCKPGDLVLFPFAREQDEQYRTSKIYTITTTYPPVVESQCIDRPKIAGILKNYTKYQSEVFCPYG